MTFPPTVIVRHTKENPKKCSVMPLKGRPDVVFYTYPHGDIPELAGYIRLAADGPPLTRADAAAGILLLDGSWRSADAMTRTYENIEPRALAGYVTAYPRVSKLGTDPSNGLASIEALYIACAILGRPTAGLLDHYHWRDEFLRRNHFAEGS